MTSASALRSAYEGSSVSSLQADKVSLLRFLTCGSVDDGKSTLIGRVLYEAGAVFEDQIEALDRDSQKFGTTNGARDYALLVDGLSAEREQGITIDVAYRYFSTPRRHFIVADTPGHEQYTRNMATGASTADVAVILVDARLGLLPQTRRHSFIVSMLGVRRVMIAINKMDLVDYSQAVYDAIVQGYHAAVSRLGFVDCQFIPLSARDGDNIATVSDAMPWYQGPTLIDWLEKVPARNQAHSQTEQGAGLFPVQWVNRPDLDFRGYAGTVAQGVLHQGDRVSILPSGQQSRIARIITADGDRAAAHAGQAVTLTLQDEIDVSRGDLLATGDVVQAGLQIDQALTVTLLVTDSVQISAGQTYGLRLGTMQSQVRIERIDYQIDIETFSPIPAHELGMNKIGRVRLVSDRPLVFTRFDQSTTLGGLLLIDRFTNQTVAFGFVQPTDQQATEQKGLPLLFSRIAGLKGTELRAQRQRQLSAWIGHRLIWTLILWATGLSLPVLAAVVAAQAVASGLFTWAHARLWRYFSTEPVFDSGDGI
jgi:bifunctional enzyme CysN/CysC